MDDENSGIIFNLSDTVLNFGIFADQGTCMSTLVMIRSRFEPIQNNEDHESIRDARPSCHSERLPRNCRCSRFTCFFSFSSS